MFQLKRQASLAIAFLSVLIAKDVEAQDNGFLNDPYFKQKPEGPRYNAFGEGRWVDFPAHSRPPIDRGVSSFPAQKFPEPTVSTSALSQFNHYGGHKEAPRPSSNSGAGPGSVPDEHGYATHLFARFIKKGRQIGEGLESLESRELPPDDKQELEKLIKRLNRLLLHIQQADKSSPHFASLIVRATNELSQEIFEPYVSLAQKNPSVTAEFASESVVVPSSTVLDHDSSSESMQDSALPLQFGISEISITGYPVPSQPSTYRSRRFPANHKSNFLGHPAGDIVEHAKTGRTISAEQDLFRRVDRVRTIMSTLRLTNSRKALDHYLAGSGAPVEIPMEKLIQIREQWGPTHEKRVYERVGPKSLVATSELARRLADSGRVHPTHWPAEMRLGPFYWRDGPSENFGRLVNNGLDDLTEYFGSTISSELFVRAERVGPFHYKLSIETWRSWVSDNYDWEGRKQFGGILGDIAGIPSQSEMRSLANLVGASPFARSSRSWRVNPTRYAPWDFEIPSEEKLMAFAQIRATVLEDNARSKAVDARNGALPDLGPFENYIP